MSHTVQRATELPPDVYVDAYGQYQLYFKWYRWSSWKPRWKYAFYGITTSTFGAVVDSWFNRRPLYANLSVKVPMCLAVTAACYWYGLYVIERNYLIRDAVIKHYVSQHPEDFSAINTAGRKYKEILLPWYPYRAMEKTIPFLSGLKPAFYKDIPGQKKEEETSEDDKEGKKESGKAKKGEQ